MKRSLSIILLTLLFCSNCNKNHPSSVFEEKIINRNSAFNLIVLFDRDDCMACLGEIKSFNKLSKLTKNNLTVKGIVNSNDTSLIKSFVDRNNISFEVVGNPQIFQKYTSGQTPEQLLVNTKNYEIIYKSKRKKIGSSQEATFEIINLIIRNQM